MKLLSITLIVFALVAYVHCAPTKRTKAIDPSGRNQKIDLFFKPVNNAGVEKRKKPTNEPICPGAGCRATMKKHVSRSSKNNGREYQKCPACEVFQWTDDMSWCDKNGNWCDTSSHWPDDRYIHRELMEMADTNYHLRIQSNAEMRNKIFAMKRSGEWETLPTEQQEHYTWLEEHIQRDPAF